jgi:hypothetical protein
VEIMDRFSLRIAVAIALALLSIILLFIGGQASAICVLSAFISGRLLGS